MYNSILLKYEDGTNAVINYFANGSKFYSKERIEAYNQGKTLIIDNWRTLKGYGTKGFSKKKTRLDKGHKNQFKLLVESIQQGKPLIPFDVDSKHNQSKLCCERKFEAGEMDRGPLIARILREIIRNDAALI